MIPMMLIQNGCLTPEGERVRDTLVSRFTKATLAVGMDEATDVDEYREVVIEAINKVAQSIEKSKYLGGLIA